MSWDMNQIARLAPTRSASRGDAATGRSVGRARLREGTSFTGGGKGIKGEKCVAYLANVYPKVSHTFIRTEILALEREGFSVSRYTVRHATGGFSDDEDEAEARKTVALYDRGLARLTVAAAVCLLQRPRTASAALWSSIRSNRRGGLLRACAYFAQAAVLSKDLMNAGVRHIHAHFGNNPASVARLVAQLAPITYSFTVHGPDEFDAPVFDDLPGKIAEASFVAGVSSFGRSQLMRWSEPDHWSRIHVIRCAAAPSFLEEGAGGLLGLQSTRLACVARLSPAKGLPLLIEAVAQVASQRPLIVDIIGDGEGRAAIEAQIAHLGVEANVHLLGWRSAADIRRTLESSRALVLPSFAEGLPVVLMEALALRRPVIACAVAGVPELVDADVGWLIPSGSVKSLVDALHAVLDAPVGKLKKMGDQGRERVRAMHDPDINASELSALLAPWV